MKLFAVTAGCGDYYCGCGVGHLLGIYTDEDAANEAAEKARYQEAHWEMYDGTPKVSKSWSEVSVISGEADQPITLHVRTKGPTGPEWRP